MTTTLDTLQILIEADSRGLESQLKKSGSTITSFIQKMNSQEINWESIMAGTINTAIISGIASTFALAISSATSFQNSIIQSGQNSQNAFLDNSGQISDAVKGISNTTGQSATDIAESMGKIIQLFGKDTPTAIAAMEGASKLATITGMNLGDVVDMLIPIFDNWGINSVPGVTKAIQDLFAASKTGKIDLQSLASTIGSAGVALRDHTDFSTTVFQIEQISNQAGMTKKTTVDAFNQIAESALQSYDQLNIMAGGIGSIGKSLDKEGIVGGFEAITKAIKNSGLSASLFGQITGVNTEAVKVLGKQSAEAYNASKIGADQAKDSAKSLNTEFERSLTFTKELQIAGSLIFNTLGSVFSELNTKLGKFIEEIINAKNPMDFINALGGEFKNQTTPMLPNGMKPFYAPQSNSPTENTIQKNSNVTLNITNNVNGANGDGKNVGGNIADQLYNMLQGTNPI